MAEEKKLTRDELLEAEAYFNMASLLGKSIQAIQFDITHPNYIPVRFAVEDKPAPPADVEEEEEPEEEEPADDHGSEPAPDGSVIHSNEASLDTQIDQLVALYHDGVREFLNGCALYDMFRLASAQFSYELTADDMDKELSPSDKQKTALAWVIVKRVFAVRHPDETVLIVSASEGTIREAKRPDFRPMDSTDRQFIEETCRLFAGDFEEEEEGPHDEGFMAEKLEQLRHSTVISTPTSLAFWHQSEAAATGIRKKDGAKLPLQIPDVYTKPIPADIELTIADSEGKPIEITGFDMALQATIGQMIRENGNKPIQATPAQLFRKCAGLDANASVSPASIEETVAAINKMRQADTTILYAQQLEAFLKRKGSNEKKQPDFDYSVSKIEGKLINADRIRTAHVAANGKIVDDVFTFYRAPIIEHYSYGFRQLMEVDRKYLAGALNKATPENISFARYMLVQINRIKQIKEKKKVPAHEPYTESLTFDKIATRCVYDISSRSKLRNFQTKVYSYCENLVSMGHIKKVEQDYKGRVYTGIKITV